MINVSPEFKQFVYDALFNMYPITLPALLIGGVILLLVLDLFRAMAVNYVTDSEPEAKLIVIPWILARKKQSTLTAAMIPKVTMKTDSEHDVRDRKHIHWLQINEYWTYLGFSTSKDLQLARDLIILFGRSAASAIMLRPQKALEDFNKSDPFWDFISVLWGWVWRVFAVAVLFRISWALAAFALSAYGILWTARGITRVTKKLTRHVNDLNAHKPAEEAPADGNPA